jgi:hypothetical protein
MNIRLGFRSFFTVSTLLLCFTPAAIASDDSDARDVRISWVQGDVRLSRGDGKHTDLNKSWEQAQGGELLERGFAVATGNGRAEIEFEDGSTAYLAENSLLLFRELSALDERVVTRMTLPTGTATFALQPATGESFFIETPTDQIQLSPPETLFARMDAYLDATAITPQGEKGEALIRNGFPKLILPKGHTLFFRGGEVVPISDPAQTSSSKSQNAWLPFDLPGLLATASAVRASGLAPLVPGGLFLEGLPSLSALARQTPPSHTTVQLPSSAAIPSLAAAHWDSWVFSRVQDRGAITNAALKASGLSSPIPGLYDLYTHGSFFQCEPYGTCWEPASDEQLQVSSPQTSQTNAQSPAQNAPNTGFQPETVEWMETSWGLCNSYSSRRISRIAHTPQELEELLRFKARAERDSLRGTFYSSSCLNGTWIPHRNHYARVLTPQIFAKCAGKKCKPVHPPHPLLVRVGSKVGFVPRHPNDVKGKPPLNLKHGIIVPPGKPGEAARRVAVDATQKVKILDKIPVEFQREFLIHSLPVAAPEIRAHLMQEGARGKSIAEGNHADSHIVYDYKTQKFMMPGAVVAGGRAREVSVGGIASNGRVASFADGHSGRYADSFGRSNAAASYNGGAHNSGASYGGGRGSGSYSSGSSYSGGGGSSGSHTSGSSSSGSSSHTSGGGSGGSVSSASGSSSSSSSSSSGASRGRPQ